MSTLGRQKTALFKSHKSYQIYSSVTCVSTTPVNDRLAPSPHGVDQSGDTLLWEGIPLNLQKLRQVMQVAIVVDVGIYRSLQLVP
jgi:hypothetical protein